MRGKRNSIFHKSWTNELNMGKGYIETYLKDEIDLLLTSDQNMYQNLSFDPYVSHQEAEAFLNDALIGKYSIDKLLIFSGLTGSGKSTIIRHVFQIKKDQIRFANNTLIVPIDFNRRNSSSDMAYICVLQNALEILTTEYDIPFPDTKNQQFAQYIREEKRSGLLNLAPPKLGRLSDEEKLHYLSENSPLTYSSCQLQYVMDHEKCKAKTLIFVIDNIEGYIEDGQETHSYDPLISALELAECFHDRGEKTKWCFNMVIACRHHIVRLMRSIMYRTTSIANSLNSYMETSSYDLKNPVKIYDIIQKRKEALEPSQSRKNISKWKQAVSVVDEIIRRTDESVGNFILQLNLKDIRQSLSTLKSLVFNKKLQKAANEEIAGSFNIQSVEQFDLSQINFLKILGLGDLNYYYGNESIIPNLLWNDEIPGSEMLLLMTLRFFMIRCNDREPNWENSASIKLFYRSASAIFGFEHEVIHQKFDAIIVYLFQHRLLLRSADQPQTQIPGLSESEIEKIELCYVSGLAVALWKKLSESSALFQLFMDDIWFDNIDDFSHTNGKDIEHCLKYLEILIEKEQEIYYTARNIGKEADYKSAFGHTAICCQLADGLVKSLNAITYSQKAVFDIYEVPHPRDATQALKKAQLLKRKAETLFN